ncbi:MAG: inosine/uridine nucleosidase, partial [Solirubrobacteraceae bacterium]|nr:inosine/uridine nucleosidase [Solirubrobacteraceae bacterium]
DLRAITPVGGNGTLAAVTYNARRVCTLAGLRDVPVAAGAEGPLRGELHTAADVHGESGLDGPELPEPDIELDQRPAAALMADVLREAQEPITLVATGPLTNVAVLLESAPDVHDKIERIVWMGGSRGRGNRTPYAEFNAWVDPEAAAICVAGGVPFTLVGLHLTHQALATPEVVERIRAVGGVLGEVAADWLAYFSSTYRAIWGFDAPLHDPCALAIALDPTFATWEDAFVAIETEGRWTRGATVVDPYGRLGMEPNARVPLELDVERFWATLVAALGAIGAATP